MSFNIEETNDKIEKTLYCPYCGEDNFQTSMPNPNEGIIWRCKTCGKSYKTKEIVFNKKETK